MGLSPAKVNHQDTYILHDWPEISMAGTKEKKQIRLQPTAASAALLTPLPQQEMGIECLIWYLTPFITPNRHTGLVGCSTWTYQRSNA